VEGNGASQIPLQLSRGCVVASIQIDFDSEVVTRFRSDLLQFVHASQSSRVIIDLSGVEIMDADDFEALRRTLSMVALMGARPILAGLRPGVVSGLVGLGIDTEGVEAALNLDEAFKLFDGADSESEPLDDADTEEDARPGNVEAEVSEQRGGDQDASGIEPDSYRW
jgi:rsbT antagonist protein RsbS